MLWLFWIQQPEIQQNAWEYKYQYGAYKFDENYNISVYNFIKGK